MLASVDGTIGPAEQARHPGHRRGTDPRGRRRSRSSGCTAGGRSRSRSTWCGWRTAAPGCDCDYDDDAVRAEVAALLEAAGPVEALLRVVLTRGGRRIMTVEPLPAQPDDGARRDRDLLANARPRRAQDALLRREHARRATRARARVRRGAARHPARPRAGGPDVVVLLGRRRPAAARRRWRTASSPRSRVRT